MCSTTCASDREQLLRRPVDFNANAQLTGACAADDVTYGVKSQGVEIEGSFRPRRDMVVNLGLTYANTKYRDDLVGNDTGAPLDPALRKLPGDNLSNAPSLVGIASLTWTPPIGGSGMSGLFYVDARMTNDYNTGSDLFPRGRTTIDHQRPRRPSRAEARCSRGLAQNFSTR